MEHTAEELGLHSNATKLEVICNNESTLAEFLWAISSFQVTPPKMSSLLGSPLDAAIDDCVGEQIGCLKTLEERIHFLDAHDALLLLRNSLTVSSLLYTLHTPQCFFSAQLLVLDVTVQSILRRIMNVSFSSGDSIWKLAPLAVRFGELGVHSASHLAPSTFLSSVSATVNLVECILPSLVHDYVL